MTRNVSHWFVRKAKMTFFAFRGAKNREWAFCDPIKNTEKRAREREMQPSAPMTSFPAKDEAGKEIQV